MKKHIVIILTFSLFAISGYSQQNSQPLNLLYNQPSKIWEEALPLGNGITGAMVFGGINKEQYALNDHTLWSGGPIPGNQPKGPEMLAKVREAIFAGDYLKGAELWKGMHGPYSARYLTMGDLLLNFNFADTLVENYN
jgi:alpha-L-fucosidase 2